LPPAAGVRYHDIDITSIHQCDTQIAGIALARRATLATRNVRHFADLKVPVVNPWEPHDQ